jgi:hypothetical protein
MNVNDDDKGLLDALNEAIEDTLPEESEVQDEPETPTEEGETEHEAEPETEEEESEEKPEDSEAEPETEEGSEEKPEEPKAEAPKEPPPPIDPINDPIPTGVAQRTRERIETLIERVKEGERYKSERDEIIGLLQSTGASPEDLNNTIQYMRLVHSPSLDDKRKALEVLRAEVQALAVEVGDANIPGFDPLAQFPDLVDAVVVKDITEDHAKEIALSRMRQQRDQTRQSEVAQRQQAQSTAQQAVEYGKQQLTALEQRLMADPDYRTKYDILVPMLKPTMQSLHPSQWATVFENAYVNLKLPAAAPTPKPAPKNQPLRAKAPAGEGSKGISSAEEALDAALGSLGR